MIAPLGASFGSPLSTGPVRDPGDGGYQAFTHPSNPIGIALLSDEMGWSIGNPDGIGWYGCSVTRHPQADTWLEGTATKDNVADVAIW